MTRCKSPVCFFCPAVLQLSTFQKKNTSSFVRRAWWFYQPVPWRMTGRGQAETKRQLRVRQKVCWSAKGNCSRESILCHLDWSPHRTSTVSPRFTDDHRVQCQEDNLSDLSWEINEPERRAALTVRRFLVHRRLSLVRPFKVKRTLITVESR